MLGRLRDPSVGLAIVTLVVAVAYAPLPSYSTVGRWAVMSLASLLLWGARPRVGPGLLMAGAVAAWCVASLAWTTDPLDTVGELYHLLLVAIVFYVAAASEDIRPAAAALGAGVVASALLVPLQLDGLRPVSQVTGGAAGLFLNKDFLGQVASPALLVSAALGQWWAAPAELVALVGSGSRSAWAATAAGGLLLVPPGPVRRRLVVALLIAGAALLFLDLSLGGAGRLSSLNDRLVFWQATWANVTALGYGLGSYPAVWPGWEHAHDELLELAFEVGWIGVLPMIGVIAYAVTTRGHLAARAALVSLLVSCAVYFPLHEPTTALLVALLAGYLCGARDRLRAARPEGRADRRPSSERDRAVGRGSVRWTARGVARLSIRPELARGAGGVPGGLQPIGEGA